jgi:hypothetical protein
MLVLAFFKVTLAFKILPNEGVTVIVLVEIVVFELLLDVGAILSSFISQPTNNKAAHKPLNACCGRIKAIFLLLN